MRVLNVLLQPSMHSSYRYRHAAGVTPAPRVLQPLTTTPLLSRDHITATIPPKRVYESAEPLASSIAPQASWWSWSRPHARRPAAPAR